MLAAGRHREDADRHILQGVLSCSSAAGKVLGKCVQHKTGDSPSSGVKNRATNLQAAPDCCEMRRRILPGGVGLTRVYGSSNLAAHSPSGQQQEACRACPQAAAAALTAVAVQPACKPGCQRSSGTCSFTGAEATAWSQELAAIWPNAVVSP